MLPKYSEVKDKVLLCPSILSADFACLRDDIQRVAAQTDWIHVDVMDGHYVPNLTIGAPVVKSLRKHTDLPLDCHLMVTNPDQYIDDFARAGADGMTVHAEACKHLHRTIQTIKSAGMSAGVSLNPATSLAVLEEILPELDMVLLMSVNPGFGGQSYILSVTDKVRRLRHMIEERNLDIHIQVDGGITAKNIATVYQAGANALVAGSAVFGANDPLQAIVEMKKLCVI